MMKMMYSPTSTLPSTTPHTKPHTQISDDEDDVHPNIDTPSLFRWRHQARIDRMKESEDAKKCLENEKIALVQRNVC